MVNILDISPRLLMLFLDLCRTSSITRSAENLGLSQPSASRNLATLRDALKDPLFIPSGRGVVPTPTALRLVPQIESMIAQYERLPGAGTASPVEMSGVIRVATTDYGAMVALGPAIRRLQTEAPNLAIEVFPLDNELFPKLLDGRLDFAFYVDDPMPAEIDFCDLFEESHVFVVSSGHPLASLKSLSRSDIDDYPRLLVNIIGDRHAYVDDRSLGRASPGLWIPYFAAAPIVLTQSDMVMALPKRAAEFLMGAAPLTLLPVEPEEAPFTYRLLWSRNVGNDPMISWARSVVQDAARD